MNAISFCVQVAFIMAGSTHAVYSKTLSRALGMNTVSNVKDVLDKMCEGF